MGEMKTIINLLEELLKEFNKDKEGTDKTTFIFCPLKLYDMLSLEQTPSFDPQKKELLAMLKRVLKEECGDLFGFEKNGTFYGLPIYFLSELKYVVFIDPERSKILSVHQEEFIRRMPYILGRQETS